MCQDVMGVGVLGLGGRGVHLAQTMQQVAGARIAALCDRNAQRVQVARQRLGDTTLSGYVSSAEMLADPNVDAVIVATHDQAHVENGQQVLRAGKHLFLEKPMAQSTEDCDALIETWQETQTVFMIGLELRFVSLCEDLKRTIDRGDIGQVKLGYAVDNVSVGGQYFFHGPMRSRDFVGNLLLQKGTHTLDLMNWWIDAQPVRVYAEGGLDVFGGQEPRDKRCRNCDRATSCPYFLSNDYTLDYGETLTDRDDFCVWSEDVDVDDNAIVVVRYDNGAKLTFVECHFTPDYNRHFTLIGTKGRIYGFYNNEQQLRLEVTYRHSDRKDVIHPERREGSHGGGDPRILREFINWIRRGEPACPGVVGARNSTAIAAAAARACETGLPVVIPPCPLIRDAVNA